MKKPLTQEDVNVYLHSKFSRSRLYPGKLISLDHGTYVMIRNAAIIATLELRKDFEFSEEGAANMLALGITKMKFTSTGQLLRLTDMFPHWQFFNDHLKSGKKRPLNDVLSMFRAAFPFEDRGTKNFYKKLEHWAVENTYNINVVGGMFYKFLIITK